MAHNLALILDMDGVLIDSNPVHRRAWTEYARRFGIETDQAMLERMYGRRNDDIVRDYFGENLTAEVVRRHGAAKERLYRETIGPVVHEALVPGVREFLERHRDWPIGLASNAGPENVNFVLDVSGLRSYFRAVVDGHQAPNPKPHPDLYLLAARLLGADPGRCIVFEDSLAGIQAARAAGMSLVGLRTTHDHLPDVDLEIENFKSPELEPWLGSR